MSHYTKITDVIDAINGLIPQIRIGPDGEGSDWKNTLEACLDDLEDVLDDLEPSEEEQGLIPIPAGYNEA